MVGRVSDCRSRGWEFEPQLAHIFRGDDYEIISKAILYLAQIQEGQLSVTDKSMCTSTG